MTIQAAELRKIINDFPNGSKRHHHALVRQLAEQLLQVSLENVLLKTMVPGQPIRDVVQLDPCEEDAA
jgi:hypothetical protein